MEKRQEEFEKRVDSGFGDMQKTIDKVYSRIDEKTDMIAERIDNILLRINKL
jgi:hypothetical protein